MGHVKKREDPDQWAVTSRARREAGLRRTKILGDERTLQRTHHARAQSYAQQQRQHKPTRSM